MFKTRRSIEGPYHFGVGVCGSLNPGLTVKGFIAEESAVELVVGTRWKGVSITPLYEICIATGAKGPGFFWNFGGGPRFGFYNGSNYRDYLGLNRENRTYSMIGIVGTLGFEYYFSKIPFTIGLDYRPFFDLKSQDDSILDGVLSIRYAF